MQSLVVPQNANECKESGTELFSPSLNFFIQARWIAVLVDADGNDTYFVFVPANSSLVAK